MLLLRGVVRVATARARGSMPHESMAPLAIIAGAFSVAGGIMYLHNYCKFGKPRPTGQDDFGT